MIEAGQHKGRPYHNGNVLLPNGMPAHEGEVIMNLDSGYGTKRLQQLEVELRGFIKVQTLHAYSKCMFFSHSDFF